MIDKKDHLSVEEVAKAFKIPASMLQDMDRPKYNEIEEKVATFTKNFLRPLLRKKAREIKLLMNDK